MREKTHCDSSSHEPLHHGFTSSLHLHNKVENLHLSTDCINSGVSVCFCSNLSTKFCKLLCKYFPHNTKMFYLEKEICDVNTFMWLNNGKLINKNIERKLVLTRVWVCVRLFFSSNISLPAWLWWPCWLRLECGYQGTSMCLQSLGRNLEASPAL